MVRAFDAKDCGWGCLARVPRGPLVCLRPGTKYMKNEKSKKAIKEKIIEYMDRAEQIKAHLPPTHTPYWKSMMLAHRVLAKFVRPQSPLVRPRCQETLAKEAGSKKKAVTAGVGTKGGAKKTGASLGR